MFSPVGLLLAVVVGVVVYLLAHSILIALLVGLLVFILFGGYGWYGRRGGPPPA